MGLIAFPFIVCLIMAIFGWPLLIIVPRYMDRKEQKRKELFEKKMEAGTYKRELIQAELKRKKKHILSSEELEEIYMKCEEKYGVRPSL